MTFEVLDLSLMFFGFFARVERSKIFAFSRFRVFLFRI